MSTGFNPLGSKRPSGDMKQAQEVGAVLSACGVTQPFPDVALPLTVTSGTEVFVLRVSDAYESALASSPNTLRLS